MSEQVLVAFDMLLEAINEERPQLANVVQKAVLQSRFDEVQELVIQAQKIDKIEGQVEQLKEVWKEVYRISINKIANDTLVKNGCSSPNHKHIVLIGDKINVSEMENKVNAYRRYDRLLYIISARHLGKYQDLLGIKSSKHFAVFKEGYNSQGGNYRFVKSISAQESPSALCEAIDREICGKHNTTNGVNSTTFSRHERYKWDYSKYPVPTIEDLIKNIEY